MMGGCMSGGSIQGSTFRDMKEELAWKNKVMMVVKDNTVMITPLILMNIRDEGSKRNVKRMGEHEEIGRSASLFKTVKMVCGRCMNVKISTYMFFRREIIQI